MKINKQQKNVLIGVASLIVAALIYPPYRVFGWGVASSTVLESGYEFLFSLPDRASVDVLTLLAEWIGICLVGWILFQIASQQESEVEK
jgi:hypothetical protein